MEQQLSSTQSAPDRADARPLDYSCSVARDRKEVSAAQGLRREVLGEEFPGLAARSPAGLDTDRHDEFAEHLVVRENRSGTVVGTYRMISPDAAAQAGGLYSAGLFDLSALAAIRARLLEIGRACVHCDHRNGAVINLLWRGIAAYAAQTGCSHVAGSPSIPLTDGGSTAAGMWDELRRTRLAPPEFRVAPHNPWIADGVPRPARLAVPPVVRAYLRAGGLVCGPPAHNTAFPSADLFMLLDVSTMSQRYARRYLEYR
jgi:putative hemolysin